MLTEKEAKTKWCPMSRCYGMSGDNVDLAGINRDYRKPEDPHPGSFYQESRCLGSDCMMWIIIEQEPKRTKIIAGIKCRQMPDDKGYCGFAGKL